MSCDYHKTFDNIFFTEEAILNDDFVPEYMKGGKWRRYRIEYGFECSCPEGVIYLPARFDSQLARDLLCDLMRIYDV